MGRRPKRLDPKDPLHAFALELRTLRDNAGLSGREAATRTAAGISRTTYYAWMEGRQLPGRDALERVVRAWGGDWEYWVLRRRDAEDRLALLSPKQTIALQQHAPPSQAAQIALPKEPSTDSTKRTGLRSADQPNAAQQAMIQQAQEILRRMGFDENRSNLRSALVLLCLLDLRPSEKWQDAQRPLVRSRDIIEWIEKEYSVRYAANSRETIRRGTLHHFVEAGIVIENPDNPGRALNSPRWHIQIEPATHLLITSYSTPRFDQNLKEYLTLRRTPRVLRTAESASDAVAGILDHSDKLPVANSRSSLLSKIVEEFHPRHTPGGALLLIQQGDHRLIDDAHLARLGIPASIHGNLPDVVIYQENKNLLTLIEAVESHGPFDNQRLTELSSLLRDAQADLSFVSAFKSRSLLRRFIADIASESEIWCADEPENVISLRSPSRTHHNQESS